MSNPQYKDFPRPATHEFAGAAGVNIACHGNIDGVRSHDKRVLAEPFVIPVFWGSFYTKTDKRSLRINLGPATMMDFLTEIVAAPGSPWMNGLAQYDVREGSVMFEPSFVTTGTDPIGVTQADVLQALTGWLSNESQIVSTPDANELSRLYLIFLPPTTDMTDEPGACGYHAHAKFKKTVGDDNLFFAVIGTKGRIVDGQSGQVFVDAISYCVSHELAESFTNPDDRGWFTDANHCEIGDLCECVMPGCTSANAFPYLGLWLVESYWSQKDGACWPVPGPLASMPAAPTAPPVISIPPIPKSPVKSPEFCDELQRKLSQLAGDLDAEQSKPQSQQSPVVVQQIKREIAKVAVDFDRFCLN